MKVTLTGANGFIGSHILTELHEHGHQVTALIRDDAQAAAVAANGATPVVIDLYDRPAVIKTLETADAAIHTASPGDATSADLDGAVADAVTSAFDGTGRPYLQISGEWIYGSNTAITEASAAAVDAPGAVPGSDEEVKARLGDYFAQVLLLDQGTDAARARDELDWDPSHPSLTEEFLHGSYSR